MYGMIHTAARELVLEQYGQKVWDSIIARTGMVETQFLSAQVYEDEVTFGLVQAIADESKTPLDEMLEILGVFWVRYTANSTFKAVYKMYGADFPSFLSNLNRVHDTVRLSMPKIQTPKFEVENVTESSLEVLYASDREGLETFNIGLLKGLYNHFGLEGTVECCGAEEEGIRFRLAFHKK